MGSVAKRAHWLALTGALAAAALASALAIVDCGSPSSAPDAGMVFDAGIADGGAQSEVGVDAGYLPDASGRSVSCQLVDAIAGCPAASPDGAALSDWPGWERVPGLEPCCVVDRPIAADAAGGAMAWIPCPDEDGGCMQLANPPDPGQGPFIRNASVARDDAGNARYLQIRWALSIDNRLVQDTIFDVASGNVVSAMRHDALVCFALLDVSEKMAALTIHYDGPRGSRNLTVARGAPSTIFDAPRFECVWNARGSLNLLQEHGISNEGVGFDTTDYTVYRTGAEAGTWVATPPANITPAPGLLFDLIAGKDVYASTSAFGYMREYTVRNDGTPLLYRAKQDRDVSAFATDGTTMFWVESPLPDGNPIAHEVWAAPYTSDGTALDRNARKIATLSSVPRIIQAVAVNGLYAVAPTSTELAVVRIADGAIRRRTASKRDLFLGQILHVTPQELWLVVAQPSGAAFIRRYDLGTW